MPLFREAREASVAFNAAKTLAQVVVFWSVFLFVIPPLLVRVERGTPLERFVFPSIGMLSAGVLFALAGCVGLWSSWEMVARGRGTPLPLDAPRRLVIGGPYRFVRNPMACAGLMQGVAIGLYDGSPLVLAYCVAGGIVWNGLVRPLEEADLESRFGDEYRAYRRCVRCWIPRVPMPRAKADER